DRGVDQQADLVRVDAGVGQRLHPGQGGGVGGLHVAVPEAARVDAGDVPEDIGADLQPVERRLQAGIDLVGGQPARGVDVGETGNGYVLEQHGRAAVRGQEQRPPRVPAYGGRCTVLGESQL